MTYEELWHSLTTVYDTGEARAVARWLMEVAFGLTMTDIIGGGMEKLSDAEQQRLSTMQQRLLKGEPVQYVTGKADFGPIQIDVAPGVLIPRPETYELCQWVLSSFSGKPQKQDNLLTVLDIGTGSGCIACTLALQLAEAKVTAWDISAETLAIAQRNAALLQVGVTFERRDALQLPTEQNRWDVIISNPPYICQQEQKDMERHVLEHEPHLALFVPDDSPLLFYRAIAHYARKALRNQGELYFEINPLYCEELLTMLHEEGLEQTEVRCDQFGKRRFVKAIRL